MKNNVNQLISLLYSNSIARVKINQPKLGIFPKVLELDIYIFFYFYVLHFTFFNFTFG